MHSMLKFVSDFYCSCKKKIMECFMNSHVILASLPCIIPILAHALPKPALFLLLNFAMNLKLLWKNKSIKKGGEKGRGDNKRQR